MKLKTCLFISTLAVLSPLCQAATTLDLKQMRDYFKKNIAGGPYIYLQSPRTGLGVGTIYTIVDSQMVFYSRPEDCFTSPFLTKARTPPQEDSMAVDTFDRTGKYSWQLGLKVANAGPITKEVDAEFTNKHVTSMTISMPYLKRQLITIKDLKAAVDKDMDMDCSSVLTATKPERWVIIEALYTDKFSIAFQDESGRSISISGGLLKILFPSMKYDSSGMDKGALSFSGQDHIVAVKAVKVKDINKYAAGEKDFATIDPDGFYAVIDKR